jgi:cytochrome c oxidase cbb3-type subunit III
MTSRSLSILIAPLIATFLPCCEREQRDFKTKSSAQQSVTRQTDLQPGEKLPTFATPNPYEKQAWALGQGKTLYRNFNCVGCHANGGGGIGPPLMDDQWVYGSEPQQIVATILEGRPNGMPSFAGKITNDQVWMLAAYVRSISGNARKDAAPGRDDHLQIKPPEHSTPEQPPKSTATPPIPKAPG